MDTATASLENKPLKETEGPLDDSSLGPECYQLAAAMKRKKKKRKETNRLHNRLSAADYKSG